jgi:hypothetical protein
LVILYNLWAGFSLALYYFGPVNWTGRHSPAVALFVGLCVIAFDIGYLMQRRAPGVPKQLPVVPTTTLAARVIVVAHAVLTFIYLAAITGRVVINPADYSLNFGAVYAEYGLAIANRKVRLAVQIVTLVKACLFPIALVIFIDRFKSDKLVVALFLLPLVVSSLFRGTDKEIADVIILVIVAAFLHRLVIWRVAAVLVSVPLAVILFLTRRLERFGGDLPRCLPDSGVCFNYDSIAARLLGDQFEVLYVFITNYVTNGYQGLFNAFSLTWQPNYGVGQLPPIKRTLCSAFDVGCRVSDYQASLTASGWNASARWTTAYTVIANDVSFWLVPVWLLLLGAAFRRCLAMWQGARDAVAGAGIVLVTIFWLYSSANMQIAISLDWTLAAVLVLYLAPWRRIREPP